MALSDQLADLASRTKRLEETAAAAEAKSRGQLEKDRDELHSQIQADAKNVQSAANEAKAQTRSWWADVTARAEQQRNDLRAKIEERKAERKVDKAIRDADDAEAYAVEMIQVAGYCIDTAEYAVADAVIARVEADELVAAS